MVNIGLSVPVVSQNLIGDNGYPTLIDGDDYYSIVSISISIILPCMKELNTISTLRGINGRNILNNIGG